MYVHCTGNMCMYNIVYVYIYYIYSSKTREEHLRARARDTANRLPWRSSAPSAPSAPPTVFTKQLA